MKRFAAALCAEPRFGRKRKCLQLDYDRTRGQTNQPRVRDAPNRIKLAKEVSSNLKDGLKSESKPKVGYYETSREHVV